MTYAERMLLVRIGKILAEKNEDIELEKMVDALAGTSTVFVYGTLREIGKKTCKLDGYRLESVALAGHMFPIIVEDKDSHVIGNVITVTSEKLAFLDDYEECNCANGPLYERKLISVDCDGKSELVWVYVPSGRKLLSDKNFRIPSGDWFSRNTDK